MGLDGKKELLGMWLSENVCANFWLGVLNELQNHEVQDTLIASIDSLKSVPDAIDTVDSIAHQTRNKKGLSYKVPRQMWFDFYCQAT